MTSPSMMPGGKCADVLNGTARPTESALPCRSRASAPTNSVYVWSACSGAPSTSVTLRPLQRRCLISTFGAISTARLAVRGSMPSLNSTHGCTAGSTAVAPESGNAASTCGGSRSGGPPEGGCRRAQLSPPASSSAHTTARAAAQAAGGRSGPSGPRVRLLIRLLEPRARDVRVHLRAGERAVPEQLLDRAQVRAGIEQVAGERVPERVRRDAHAARRLLEPLLHHALHGARRERPRMGTR